MFKSLKKKAITFFIKSKATLTNRKAEGFVDTGVKILISVVVGALVLSGLYALFGDTILPTLTSKVIGLFEFAG